MSGREKPLAISDLHVRDEENRRIVQGIAPQPADDWLLVAREIGETRTDIRATLERWSRAVRQGRVGTRQPRRPRAIHAKGGGTTLLLGGL